MMVNKQIRTQIRNSDAISYFAPQFQKLNFFVPNCSTVHLLSRSNLLTITLLLRTLHTDLLTLHLSVIDSDTFFLS